MTSFKAGDIVVADYPHVETDHVSRRPALVVSESPIGPDGLVIWVMMITAAVNKGWPGDIEVEHYQEFGLPIPSVIRTAKIATLEAEGAEKIGRIGDALLNEVRTLVKANLGLG